MSDPVNIQDTPPPAEDGRAFKRPRREEAVEDKLARLNRGLPFSDEAEKGMLSCLLQDPQERIPDARMALPAEAFYHAANRVFYEMILWCFDRNIPIDVVSLTNALRDQKKLDVIGGPAAVSEIYTFVPISAHFPHYQKVIRDKWLMRRQIEAGADNISDAMAHGASGDPDEDAAAIVMRAEERTFALIEAAQSTMGGQAVLNAQAAAAEWVDKFEIICNNRGKILGGKTGWVDVDRAFHGLNPDGEGDLFMLGGFPGMGKTGAAVTLIEQLGIEQRIPTLIFALEMGHVGIHHRLILGRAGLDVAISRNGHRPRGADEAIGQVLRDVQAAPLFWDQRPIIEIDELCAKVVQHVRRHGVKCVIIDHFGQIKPSTEAGKKDERLGQKEIMEKLHKLRRMGIIVILMVQLLKEGREKQARNRPPGTGDVRGASEMVEYPTQIGFIHRPEEIIRWHMLDEEQQERWERLTEPYRKRFPDAWSDGLALNDGETVHQRDYTEHTRFIITKNRNGPTTDDICLRYLKQLQRFRSRTQKLYSSSDDPANHQVVLPGF